MTKIRNLHNVTQNLYNYQLKDMSLLFNCIQSDHATCQYHASFLQLNCLTKICCQKQNMLFNKYLKISFEFYLYIHFIELKLSTINFHFHLNMKIVVKHFEYCKINQFSNIGFDTATFLKQYMDYICTDKINIMNLFSSENTTKRPLRGNVTKLTIPTFS